jgi:hypothetical protein
MALKIRVKSEHTFTAGDALIKNVSGRSVDLLIMNDIPVKRDDMKEKVFADKPLCAS